MILESLKLSNFRNYKSLDLKLSPKINIFFGNNAQGKTNILESIYVLGLTKSHRSSIDNNLITNGEKQSKIKGIIKKDNIKTNYEILIELKNKKYKIDNNEIKKTSDYLSKINIIIFNSEDLDLIKGSPAERRKFLNVELSQLYNNYYKVLVDYNKLLKIRNDYLKKINKGIEIDYNYFAILTEYLIEKAIFIYQTRYKFINKLNEQIKNIYFQLVNIPDFQIKYKSNINIENLTSIEIKQEMKEKYLKEQDIEIKLGTTLIGPHRDDFEFYIEQNNLKNYGSQGQQRLAIITLKLAEIEIFKNYCQTSPILLLDDVFSELDDNKKNKLLKYIHNDMQTIITTTDLKNIDKKIIKNAKIFNIEDGKIINTEKVE